MARLITSLRALVDDDGLIGREALLHSKEHDKGLGAILEHQLGSPPWRLADIEALNEWFLADLSSMVLGEQPDFPPPRQPTAGQPEEGPFSWRTEELRRLGLSVDAALRAEDAAVHAAEGGQVTLPLKAEADASVARLQRVKVSLMREVVAPLVEAADEQPCMQVALELPLVVEEIMSLLQRTSRLLLVRERRRLSSAEGVHAPANGPGRAEQVAAGDDSRKPLEDALAQLDGARKSIEQKERELACARKLSDAFDSEKSRLEARISALELKLQREKKERELAGDNRYAERLENEKLLLEARVLDLELALRTDTESSNGKEGNRQPRTARRYPGRPEWADNFGKKVAEWGRELKSNSEGEPRSARNYRGEYPGRPAWAEDLGKQVSAWGATSGDTLLTKLMKGGATSDSNSGGERGRD